MIMKKLFFLLPLLALFVACQPDDPITESGYITFTNQQVEDQPKEEQVEVEEFNLIID